MVHNTAGILEEETYGEIILVSHSYCGSNNHPPFICSKMLGFFFHFYIYSINTQ